jgi:hypothetical protein
MFDPWKEPSLSEFVNFCGCRGGGGLVVPLHHDVMDDVGEGLGWDLGQGVIIIRDGFD